jgi:Peptidase_C39 like family
MSDETKAAVQRQVDRLTAYCNNGVTSPNLDTTTKYWSQRDNIEQPHRTCNSTTNAMYLDWLLRVTGRTGLPGDQGYVNRVLGNGDTTEHTVQTQTIREYGFSTTWMTDEDTPFVDELLEAGFPVVVNILHRGSMSKPTGGHIILLVGKGDSSYVAHDPYGTLMSNYSNTNGKHSIIPVQQFKARWQGGYRILANQSN